MKRLLLSFLIGIAGLSASGYAESQTRPTLATPRPPVIADINPGMALPTKAQLPGFANYELSGKNNKYDIVAVNEATCVRVFAQLTMAKDEAQMAEFLRNASERGAVPPKEGTLSGNKVGAKAWYFAPSETGKPRGSYSFYAREGLAYLSILVTYMDIPDQGVWNRLLTDTDIKFAENLAQDCFDRLAILGYLDRTPKHIAVEKAATKAGLKQP